MDLKEEDGRGHKRKTGTKSNQGEMQPVGEPGWDVELGFL